MGHMWSLPTMARMLSTGGTAGPMLVSVFRSEYADGFEFAAAGVIIPDVINGPHVVFAHHGAYAFDRRNGRSHAGFRVEAVGAAAASGIALLAFGLSLRGVNLPVAGRYILIGSGHLDAAVAGHAGLLARGG